MPYYFTLYVTILGVYGQLYAILSGFKVTEIVCLCIIFMLPVCQTKVPVHSVKR